MNSSQYIRGLVVVALLGMGIGRFIGGTTLICDSALGQPQDSAAADAGRTYLETGVLEPVEGVDLRNEAGRPLPVLFIASPGRAVKKGDRLVELDAPALAEKRIQQVARTQRAQAELALAKASIEREERAANRQIEIAEKALRLVQGQLTAFQEAEYPSQLTAAQDEVNLAGERLAIMEANMQRLEANAKKSQGAEATQPAPEEIHVSEARIAVLEARMHLQAARDKLTFLQHVAREQRTAEIELAIAQRESDLARARDAVSDVADRGRAAVAIAETNSHLASSRLARLESQLAASTIYAPRDGTVVLPKSSTPGAPGETGIKVGDTVGNGQTILRLADVTRLKVEIPVSAEAARQIKAGEPATIRLDAFPGRTFSGRVATVLRASEVPTGYDRGRVTVTVDNPDNELKPGMTGKVELALSRRQQ
jgi:HlyD family secretion protein